MSGNRGQLAEPPSQAMEPASLGVGLGVAARELMTPLIGDIDREFTLPSTLSAGEESFDTLLTYLLAKFGRNHGDEGSRQHLFVA